VAYQSLYRKYRPQRFRELVGQEHVTTALRNAVRDSRVGHAYLFSGPRGTGKTTTARILAKALNCTNLGDDGEPCGVCDNCETIAAGRFLDLFELDAASNRGIDNIRGTARDPGLIQSASLGMSAGARTKVFVLDEFHMLTAEASNALLKTLEEAPSHVVFVLATTNPEKVLPTIRSRSQHFEFRLLTQAELIGRLAKICELEGVEADAESLGVIAAAGAGSARDAESLLDQALAHGTGRLEVGAVEDLFGAAPFTQRTRILDAIAGEDAAEALIALAELAESGHDPRRVAEELLATARDAFLLTAGAGRVRVDAPVEEQERLRALGDTLGNAAIVRVIETLGQAVTDMRGTEAADPRLVLEVALVRLSRRDAGPPLQTVIERIERLERGGGAAAAPPTQTDAPPSPRRTLGAVRARTVQERAASASRPDAQEPPVEETSTPPELVAPPAAATEPPPQAGPELDVDDVILAWGEILPELPVATRTAVQNAQPLRVDGDVVVFGVPRGMIEAAKPRFRKEADTIRTALAGRLGRSVRFNLEPADEFSLGGGPAARPERTNVGAPPPESEDAFDDDMPADHEIDLSRTGDAALAGPAPVSMLQRQLGATVVEEVPRDVG
jgi:DNA polymerase-3 subunit gamma/tau